MPDDAKTAIMASRASVISIALLGCLFAAAGIITWYQGTWSYTAGLTAGVFALVWSFFIYRLVRYPLIVLKDDTLEIILYPLRSKRIALNDIKDVYSSWDHEARILLANGKKIHIPVSMMKKTDHEFVLLKLRK